MKYNIEFSFSVVFDILIVIAEDVIFNLFILFLIFVIGTMNVLVITMLAKFPQGRTVGFATPGVPITPILGIAINFYLMLRLSPLTLIRFTVWMVLGILGWFLTANDTFLHRKRISPRKLFLGQGKVFPRAVFNPPRVGFAASSEARAVIETQGGLKTARGYTFV